jgi:hypothetical protein
LVLGSWFFDAGSWFLVDEGGWRGWIKPAPLECDVYRRTKKSKKSKTEEVEEVENRMLTRMIHQPEGISPMALALEIMVFNSFHSCRLAHHLRQA